MANKSEKVSNLKKELQRIPKPDQVRLIERQEWGETGYEKSQPIEEIQSEIERTYRLAQQLINLPIERLLEKTIDDISDKARQVNGSYEQFDDQSKIETASDMDLIKANYINPIQQTTNAFFEASAPWVAYLACCHGDFDQKPRIFLNPSMHKTKEADERMDKMLSDAKTKMDKINEIIAKAREASAKEVAAVFTKDFEKVANEMEKSAKNWLWATGILAFLTLVASAGMWYWTEAGLDQGQIFQKIGTKMVVLAVLLTGTIWCGRNYRALKHLATINNHRALSICTLQAFSNAAAQAQTKDAVLLEATRAVFGNVPTGFIGQTSSDSDLKVIEVARNILPESDSK